MSNWIKVSDKLPENGKPVIAYIKNFGGGKFSRRIRAMYARKFELEADSEWTDGGWGDYCKKRDEYFCPEGWYENNCYDEMNWQVSDEVTHWQPLPEAPNE